MSYDEPAMSGTRQVSGGEPAVPGVRPVSGCQPAGSDRRFADGDLPALIHLPGGSFQMGNDAGRDDERPAHAATVAAFLLARTQVSNRQYDAFVAATGYPEAPFRRQPEFAAAEQPVVGISWFDAVAYCRWLGEARGLVYRLPTEAEWEWAARGGEPGKLYPWGDQSPWEHYPDYGELWRSGPELVGRHLSNRFELFELCENVHEWCADWYDPRAYANGGFPAAGGKRRASRGGAWRHRVKVSTCAARSSIPPDFRYADYGFRVAADVPH